MEIRLLTSTVISGDCWLTAGQTYVCVCATNQGLCCWGAVQVIPRFCHLMDKTIKTHTDRWPIIDKPSWAANFFILWIDGRLDVRVWSTHHKDTCIMHIFITIRTQTTKHLCRGCHVAHDYKSQKSEEKERETEGSWAMGCCMVVTMVTVLRTIEGCFLPQSTKLQLSFFLVQRIMKPPPFRLKENIAD